MKKLAKEYVNNAKALFPIMGKSERNYLKTLEQDVEEYCIESEISSLNELYTSYGSPSDVVHSFYQTVDIDYLLSRLRIAKIIKYFFTTLIVSLLVITIGYCCLLYSEHQTMKNDQIFSEETIIE